MRHANSPIRTIPVRIDLAALRNRLLQVAAIRPAAQDLAVVVDVGAALVERDAVVELEAMRVRDYSSALSAMGRCLPEPESASLQPAAGHPSFGCVRGRELPTRDRREPRLQCRELGHQDQPTVT